MTNQEFSDQFDVLYNNITSNQAPGLDEYEKSVFLTKALNELILSYFNPLSNKVGLGFDDSIIRQASFASILRTHSLYRADEDKAKEGAMAKLVIRGEEIQSKAAISIYNGTEGDIPPLKIKEITGTIEMDKPVMVFLGMVNSINNTIIIAQTLTIKIQEGISYIEDAICWVKILYNAFSIPFDDRGIIYNLPEDILLIINELLKIDRRPYHLQVIPLKYTDYAKQMTKPFKYPPKNTCWRLVLSGSGIDNRQAEIIVNPNVSIVDYRIKYIKRPMPIILAPLAGLTIEGDSGDGHTAEKQGSELDLILHPSILQRAVELAKAAYIGDLLTTVSLGAASQTDIGLQLRQQL